jgi:CRP-like cAMP-binding protein
MKNRILTALTPKEYRVMSPHLNLVMLSRGTVLYEAGEKISSVYFPNDAMISYLSGTQEGESVEVSVVGNEGLVGISSILSHNTAFRAAVQISGTAYLMSTGALRKEFKRCEVLRDLLLRYTNALLIQVAQTAVCNKFHTVEERFCRWLLQARDRSETDDLALTQDTIARILGTRRASVTVVAGDLQRLNLIRYSRGIITILNREGLEESTCECYETIATAYSEIKFSLRW